jgi:hypothetical protein
MGRGEEVWSGRTERSSAVARSLSTSRAVVAADVTEDGTAGWRECVAA